MKNFLGNHRRASSKHIPPPEISKTNPIVTCFLVLPDGQGQVTYFNIEEQIPIGSHTFVQTAKRSNRPPRNSYSHKYLLANSTAGSSSRTVRYRNRKEVSPMNSFSSKGLAP